MAWASVADVEKILPEEESVPSSGHARERLQTNLEEATDLVSAFLERQYEGEDGEDGVPGDVPGAVRRVVARVTLRAYLDDPQIPGADGVTHAMGPFSAHIDWSKEVAARDFYMTDSDEARLAQFRLSTPRAAGHVPMWGCYAP